MNNTWHTTISNKNREEIIQAGKELFLKGHLLNIKITDICTLAGVSRVTFYKYFKNMDELIFEVQINILNNMREFVKERSDLTLNGKESVKTVLYAWIDYGKVHKEELRFIVLFDLFYSSCNLDEELNLKYREFTIADANRSVLRSALDKGFLDGSIQIKDKEEASKMGLVIYQTFIGFLQRMSYTSFPTIDQSITYEDVASEVVEMIIKFIESNNISK